MHESAFVFGFVNEETVKKEMDELTSNNLERAGSLSAFSCDEWRPGGGESQMVEI